MTTLAMIEPEQIAEFKADLEAQLAEIRRRADRPR